jgi:hypothetical protein
LVRSKYQPNDALIDSKTIEQISNPFIKVMFQLQAEFGLTFSEATRLVPDIHIRGRMLWLTRDITFNHQDRTVPIRSNQQLELLDKLQDLTNLSQSMLEIHGHRAALKSYHRFMTTAGLSPKKSYRYLYAQSQYHALSKIFSHKEVYQILMQDMGLRSRTTLWGYLNE